MLIHAVFYVQHVDVNVADPLNFELKWLVQYLYEKNTQISKMALEYAWKVFITSSHQD